MAVTLNRPVAGAAAGVSLQFATNTETALIAQGLATSVARASITTGAQTSNSSSGLVAIAAGSSSVVVTNALVDANSIIYAVVSQAAADATLLRVERVLPAAGSFTIYGTANATATTLISWSVETPAAVTINA